jgi:hypothetical protein
MEEWLIIQNFFYSLSQRAQDHIDATVGGAFLSLDVARAKVLVTRLPPTTVGREIGSCHVLKECTRLMV